VPDPSCGKSSRAIGRAAAFYEDGFRLGSRPPDGVKRDISGTKRIVERRVVPTYFGPVDCLRFEYPTDNGSKESAIATTRLEYARLRQTVIRWNKPNDVENELDNVGARVHRTDGFNRRGLTPECLPIGFE
jgi:hypothetical protein